MVRFRNTLLATTALMPLGIVAAVANPLGSQVVGGAANVQGQGTSAVTVTQSTDKAIINWQSFNIGSGQTTQFVQPNASSVTLNRVTGNMGASAIDGTLTANGRVFLVNPDGILFGAGSKINTGSFLATTNDIRNGDFMAGRYQFNIPGRPDASITNLGTITAQNGGFAALVAPGVRNTGTITANFGTVGLAAGNNFSLDFYGDRLITLGINDSIAAKVIDVATGKPLNALVQNDGKLKANGGRVELTAAAARQVVDSVINNTGVIEANSIGSKNGMVVLGAATAASKPAGAPVQTVKLSGAIAAAGKRKNTKGGTIVVSGENIQLTSAAIDSSGQAGGGKVLIGGDVGGGNGNAAIAANPKAAPESFAVRTAATVNVDAATTINASAKASGDGGKVVVWSEQATTFYGTIKAQGGVQSGNGGFVETSGHQSLTFNGAVDTSAPRGKSGTLLLDPQDALITTNAGPGVVTVSSIQAALQNGDVVVTTGSTGSDAGNITVAASLNLATANALTLSAYQNIFVNAGITNTGTGALTLRADNTGMGVGTVIIPNGVAVTTNGPISIFYNPSVNPAGSIVNASSYVNPAENFSLHVAGQTLTAYMLVNSVYDLQNIQNNLSGTYALGKDIDASVTSSWNSGAGFVPIGGPSYQTNSFVGVFNGQDWVIKNLTINLPVAPPTVNSIPLTGIGLFANVGAGGLVENIGLTNAVVRGTGGVGGIVGYNLGTIANSFVNGVVVGGAVGDVGGVAGLNGGLFGEQGGVIVQSSFNGAVSGNGFSVGGLVGNNSGRVDQSFAIGSVSGTNSTGYIGGLVGINGGNGVGVISNSYSTASVSLCCSKDIGSSLGGLAGYNGGQIRNTYAVGSIVDNSNSPYPDYVGNLAAYNIGVGTITNSYATSSITGTANIFLSLTGAPLGKSGLPTGFNSTVWGSSPTINNGYPYLLWQVAGSTPPTTTTLTPTPGSSPNPIPPPGPTPIPTPAPAPPPTPPQPGSNTGALATISAQLTNRTSNLGVKIDTTMSGSTSEVSGVAPIFQPTANTFGTATGTIGIVGGQVVIGGITRSVTGGIESGNLSGSAGVSATAVQGSINVGNVGELQSDIGSVSVQASGSAGVGGIQVGLGAQANVVNTTADVHVPVGPFEIDLSANGGVGIGAHGDLSLGTKGFEATAGAGVGPEVGVSLSIKPR